VPAKTIARKQRLSPAAGSRWPESSASRWPWHAVRAARCFLKRFVADSLARDLACACSACVFRRVAAYRLVEPPSEWRLHAFSCCACSLPGLRFRARLWSVPGELFECGPTTGNSCATPRRCCMDFVNVVVQAETSRRLERFRLNFCASGGNFCSHCSKDSPVRCTACEAASRVAAEFAACVATSRATCRATAAKHQSPGRRGTPSDCRPASELGFAKMLRVSARHLW